MAINNTAAASTASTLPPDLFDTTTLVSLASTVAMLGAAWMASRRVLDASAPGPLRFLFIWHFFDAMTHLVLESSFLYHCFFSWIPLAGVTVKELNDNKYYLTPNFLGYTDRVYGPQAGGENPLAQLWMVYARADRRWAGSDVTVVALELLTVFVVGPLAALVCYDLAKKNPRANILMIILATAELYGDWMTFCPEWLVYSANLDCSNFMYLWVYLFFFNMIWVVCPVYAVYVSVKDINNAFTARAASLKGKKSK